MEITQRPLGDRITGKKVDHERAVLLCVSDGCDINSYYKAVSRNKHKDKIFSFLSLFSWGDGNQAGMIQFFLPTSMLHNSFFLYSSTDEWNQLPRISSIAQISLLALLCMHAPSRDSLRSSIFVETHERRKHVIGTAEKNEACRSSPLKKYTGPDDYWMSHLLLL